MRALDLLCDGGIPTWVKFTCVKRTQEEFEAVRVGGHFVVMAGGEVRSTRRGPVIGRLPDDSFDDLLAQVAQDPRADALK